MKKTYNIILLYVTFIVLCFSCSSPDTPEFEITEFNKTVNNCDSGSCIDIHLKYHLMKEEYPASKVFNPLMENKVFSKMSYQDEEKAKSKEEIVDRVILDYEAFKLEFPEAATGGFMQASESAITYESSQLVSIMLESEVYSGGAHGSHVKEFLNINPKTGNEIDLYKMLKQKNELKNLVEGKLRVKLGMSPHDSWSEFTFVDTFVLPDNMGLTTEGLLLIYNEYEILSFADGISELLISNDELSPFIGLKN